MDLKKGTLWERVSKEFLDLLHQIPPDQVKIAMGYYNLERHARMIKSCSTLPSNDPCLKGVLEKECDAAMAYIVKGMDMALKGEGDGEERIIIYHYGKQRLDAVLSAYQKPSHALEILGVTSR